MLTAGAEPLRMGSGSRGVLLLHGFTGGPGDLRLLAEQLADHGWTVEAPLLPGHGTTIEDCQTHSAREWMDTAEAALHRLSSSTDQPVAIVGFSMGALLALLMGARHPREVSRLALLSAPLFWASARARFMLPFLMKTGLVRWVRTLPKKPTGLPEKVAADRFVYERWPLYGVAEFAKVMAEARVALPKVQTPFLALHGAQDPTAPPSNIDILLRDTASEVKEHRVFEQSNHVLTLDTDADDVHRAVLEFLSRDASP